MQGPPNAAIVKTMAEVGAAEIVEIADTHWWDLLFERAFGQCYFE